MNVDSVSEWGSRYAFGTIIRTATRSTPTTHNVASTGSSAVSHTRTPDPAMPTAARSPMLTPPYPQRTDSRKIPVVRTACVVAITRLQVAPSARWEKHTVQASTLQISHVPRCGRVEPRSMSRT